jgi:transcriptional regulator with XRE-family HTH domain
MSIATFCRTELGLYQSDVAEAVGVTQASVSLWESRRARPSEEHLHRSVYFLVSHAYAQSRWDLIAMILGNRAESLTAEWFPLVPIADPEDREESQLGAEDEVR